MRHQSVLAAMGAVVVSGAFVAGRSSGKTSTTPAASQAAPPPQSSSSSPAPTTTLVEMIGYQDPNDPNRWIYDWPTGSQDLSERIGELRKAGWFLDPGRPADMVFVDLKPYLRHYLWRA